MCFALGDLGFYYFCIYLLKETLFFFVIGYCIFALDLYIVYYCWRFRNFLLFFMANILKLKEIIKISIVQLLNNFNFRNHY